MQRTGIQLAADGAAEYFATLDRVNQAAQTVLSAVQPLIAALNVYDDKAGAAGKATATLAADTKPAEQAFHQLDMFAGDAGDAVLTMGKDSSTAAVKVDGLGDTADTAGKKSAGLGDDAEKSSKKIGFLEQAAIGAARKLGELAVQGAAAAGQAIVDFAKDGLAAAGDFESGMNNFEAVVGGSLAGSGQSVDSFKQLFISLGRDLPVSTAEVQAAAIEMAKGGIEPATIAAGGLRQTLQFAAASGLSLSDAATIAAKTIGGWAPVNATAAEKADLLTHATDLLARAANASTVEVDELALGLYNVQGVAGAAGVPLDETVTTLALLAPAFNSSASAGDSMKNMLLRLQPATAPAADAMKDLGLVTADGNSVFYDAEGHFIGMRETAAKLQKALGPLSEAQRTEALRTIFGNDALNAANVLARSGAEGYDAMTKSLGDQMGVAEMAAKKQQGFNTAMDNMGGSLEALQITIFSAALPAVTGLINTIAGGINAVTDYMDATLKGQTVLAGIASFIGTTAIPMITGLTAGVAAWAVVQAVQATPAVLASLPAIAAQTAAFITNAAAVAAAMAPYALIALAIGGMVLAYQNFTTKVQTATQELLNSKPFWTDSTAALETYGSTSQATQQKLAPLVDLIKQERQHIDESIESLGKRMAAGQVTDEQYAREMEAINANAHALEIQTALLNDQMQAELKATAASMTATEQATKLRDGTAELGAQAQLTADDVKKLGDKIKETYEKGQEAVQGYATTQSEFLDGVEQRQADHAAQIEELERKKQNATTAEQKQGIDDQIKQVNDSYRDQEEAAAKSYARQQAEQQKHLGQMLIDYTVAQASLGNINKDKAAEITGALEREYGLQESSVASTFLRMAGSIDTFAKSSNQDVSGLTKTLHDQQQQAADTQHAMDTYAKTYTAEAVSNFLDAKGDADDYIHSLENIPSRVQSTMALPEIDDRRDELREINRQIDDIPERKTVIITVDYRTRGEAPPGRAEGGPVKAMHPYLVGERGPELIVPDRDSTVLTASETRQALAAPLAGNNSSNYSRVTNLYVSVSGSGVTYGDVVAGIRAGLQAEGQDADVRIRTGVN